MGGHGVWALGISERNIRAVESDAFVGSVLLCDAEDKSPVSRAPVSDVMI
jgi:hypothetical protein